MTIDLADRPSERKVYRQRQGARWWEERRAGDSLEATKDKEKDLYLSMVRLSTPDVVQENWNRIVLHEVDSHANGADLIAGDLLVQAKKSKEAAPGSRVDLGRVATFFTDGGRRAVLQVWKAVAEGDQHGDSIRLLEKVLTEA